MTQRANEIQWRVLVPLAAGSEEEGRGEKAHTSVAADTRTALATSTHAARLFLQRGLGQAALAHPAFEFRRQMETLRIEAKVTQAQ